MPALPGWALIPMWLATLVGAWFLTREAVRRYGA